MRKETALPVRLETDMKIRLQKAAQAMGTTPSALIRILVNSFVDEFERGGGRILFPPQWRLPPRVAEPPADFGSREKARSEHPASGRAAAKKSSRKS